MRTIKATTKTYGPSGQTATIPAGLRVTPITRGSTAGKYWLDEFPAALFPPRSMRLHDAEHYGITFDADEIGGDCYTCANCITNAWGQYFCCVHRLHGTNAHPTTNRAMLDMSGCQVFKAK